jgi:hypothetical protein
MIHEIGKSISEIEKKLNHGLLGFCGCVVSMGRKSLLFIDHHKGI